LPGSLALAWRFSLLTGLTAGLCASPWVRGSGAPLAPVAAIGLAALTVVRPGAAAGAAARCAWIACLAGAAAGLGLAAGDARLAAIDDGALRLRPGAGATVTGFVAAVPKRSDGVVRIRVDTTAGRLMVEAHEPVPELRVGSGIRATGTVREPEDWEAGYLRRLGIAEVLAASTVEPTDARRGGLPGLLDDVRNRAEDALRRGTGPAAADLLGGFVLGEDDRIDPATVDEFKRSGLAHILAVSGQNVILLAILAAALLAVLGVGHRARLIWILALIAVYVPVAGAGPSIQRAGAMGAAGIVAALSSRPRSRWYALLLAACVTLAVDPRASEDVGWQLSFAAVIGILIWSRPIASVLGGAPGTLRAAAAEGAAMTIAATIATAPLMATEFGTVSLTSLPANLVALPGEAPVMWLGMLAAALGQLAWFPVEPVTALAGACAGYIAEVAHWFAAPSWAQADVELGGWASLAATYALLAGAVTVPLRWVRRRAGGRISGPAVRRATVISAAAVAIAAGLALAPGFGGGSPAAPDPGLRVTVLDVGQGDSILLEPRHAAPVLVDAGPADSDVAATLERRGIDRLAALIETHPQSDHIGGVPDVLDRIDVARLVFARRDRPTIGVARLAGSERVAVAAGDELRAAALRLDVLWPPRQRLDAPGAGRLDPNLLSVVILAHWHGFEMLLTGDAEATDAPVSPGRVDVLKVAHHGSDDPGLEALLDRTRPRIAVICVGADNPYGHPAASTLTKLAAEGIRTLRTDTDGDLEIDVRRDGWVVR
jgi:competence protein ComEC